MSRGVRALTCLLGRCFFLGPGFRGTFAEEVHQFGSHLLRMGPVHCVRPILYDDEVRPLDQFGGSLSRRGNRHNAVCIAVNHQRGNVDAGQILAEVFIPGWYAGNRGRG